MMCYYSLPSNKILDWSKASAEEKKKKGNTKIEICFGEGRKHCGKRRKCWLPALSPFPNVFERLLSGGWGAL